MADSTGRGRVDGKTAIVTGAGSGIGEATALLLAREGASVAAVDIDEQNGQRVADAIKDDGGEAIYLNADVGKSDQVKGMIADTVGAFGGLDILHNNAIWTKYGTAVELEEEDWDRSLEVGLKALYLSAKYGIPEMQKGGGGAIVNTASVHSLCSWATHTAYDSAKAGVLGLTRVMAIDFGPEIRVNSVLPGAILTPLWDRLGISEKDRKEFAEMVPAKRLGQPDDIAYAVLYLASDEASFVTGTSLIVDGGLLSRCT
jgi:hypothetical protein